MYVNGSGKPQVLEYFRQAGAATLDVYGVEDKILNAPAPAMRMLQITTRAGFSLRSFTRITSLLLGGGCVGLSYLELSGLKIRLDDVPFMPSLRRLELFEVVVQDSFATLVRVLARVPNLEELSSTYISFWDMDRLVPKKPRMSVTPIQLSGLKRLELHEEPDLVLALLRVLPIPTLTLDLDLFSRNPAPDRFDDCHMEIAKWCLDFLCKVGDRYPAEFKEGKARFDSRGDPRTASISFAFPSYSWDDIDLPKPISTHFSFVLPMKLDQEDPLLASISVLHLRCCSQNIEDGLGVRLLSGLHTLILESYHRLEEMEAIEQWLVWRRGRIQHVLFVSCNEWIRSVANQWKEQGLVCKASWHSKGIYLPG
jgi:hypothetical protein